MSSRTPLPITRRSLIKAGIAAGISSLMTGSFVLGGCATNDYEIVYELNGGTQPDDQVTTIKHRSKIKTDDLLDPIREGYDFGGWYANPECTKKARKLVGEDDVEKRSVYAKWTLHTYAINYDLAGGILSGDAVTTYQVTSDEITLPAAERHGFSFGGWTYNGKAISSIESGSTGDRSLVATWDLASYWQQHLDETLPAIVEHDEEIAQDGGDSFVFITDPHIRKVNDPSKMTNALVSPALIGAILGQTATAKTFCGGDVLTLRATRGKAKQDLKLWQELMADNAMHLVHGNHDDNNEKKSGVADKVVIKPSFLQKLFYKKETLEATTFDYVVDNDEQKIRYLVLDTLAPTTSVITDSQIDWMRNRITELDKGWSVFVFAHRLFSPSYVASKREDLKLDACGQKIMAALDALKPTVAATIIGVMAGHAHRDYSKNSEAGIQLIATTTDSFTTARRWDYRFPDAELGDVTEHAFDVVHLNTKKRTIELTRIGRGNNRSFTY